MPMIAQILRDTKTKRISRPKKWPPARSWARNALTGQSFFNITFTLFLKRKWNENYVCLISNISWKWQRKVFTVFPYAQRIHTLLEVNTLQTGFQLSKCWSFLTVFDPWGLDDQFGLNRNAQVQVKSVPIQYLIYYHAIKIIIHHIISIIIYNRVVYWFSRH